MTGIVADQRKYLTHANGGGKLFDYAEASEDSFIDSRSELHGQVQIYNSEIRGCVIYGHAIVANAVLKNCVIDGWVRITGGAATNCHFYDQSVMAEQATAYASAFHGRSRLFGRATVRHAALRDASVYGDAGIIGRSESTVALDGFYRVGTGKWKDPPGFHRLEELEISLTESTDGHAYIACRRKTIDDWLKLGPRMGRHHGWTEEEIDQARQVLLLWKE